MELDVVEYKQAFQNSRIAYNELQREYFAMQRVLAQALLERKTPLRIQHYVIEDDYSGVEIHSQRNEMNDCTEYWATPAAAEGGR
jgi:hypothetical protein